MKSFRIRMNLMACAGVGFSIWLAATGAWGSASEPDLVGNVDLALEQFLRGGAGSPGSWRTYLGILVPLYMGNLTPVLDPFGQPIAGSNEDPETRSRIEIRVASNGIIHPPMSNGAAHPDNPLLSPDSIGGMGLNSSMPGLFAMVFPYRPETGTPIFARCFNTPTTEEATFYADSAIAIAPARGLSLVLEFGLIQPLDSRDIDTDGLVNSWEKLLGTDDCFTPDYDGDGITDLEEMLAGTAPDNSDSMLSFDSITRENTDESRQAGGIETPSLLLRFQTVPGKSYQLQFMPTLAGERNLVPVTAIGQESDVLTADEEEYVMELRVEIPEGSMAGSFCVRLVTEK